MVGPGRMLEPAELLNHVRYHFSRGGILQGKKVIVSAGGTREAIDPVRFICNRSSGKQGYALAQAALDAGADVTLISTTPDLTAPTGATVINVESAAQMLTAVQQACVDAHLLIMAAAVADFTSEHEHTQKIKKESGLSVLNLKPTTDILKAIASQRKESGFPRYVIGFAAESEDLLVNASKKLESKNLDLIAANNILSSDSGFEVDTNRVILIPRSGKPQELPLLSKLEVAQKIIEMVSSWG